MTANISLCWSTLAPRQNYKLTHLFFWKSPHCLVLQNLFFALQSLISSFIQSPKNNKKKWVTEWSWLPIRRAASLAPCRSLIEPFSPPEFNLEAVQDGFQVDSWVTLHHIHLVWARSFKWTKSRGEEFLDVFSWYRDTRVWYEMKHWAVVGLVLLVVRISFEDTSTRWERFFFPRPLYL